MSCCGGNQTKNKKVKEWGDGNTKDNSGKKSNYILLTIGLLLAGFIIFKLII